MLVNLGAVSAQLLFWLLLCPKCVFEVDIKNIGYQTINYGQKIACECPNCHEVIIKTCGIDLGVMSDKSVISLPAGKLSPPEQQIP